MLKCFLFRLWSEAIFISHIYVSAVMEASFSTGIGPSHGCTAECPHGACPVTGAAPACPLSPYQGASSFSSHARTSSPTLPRPRGAGRFSHSGFSVLRCPSPGAGGNLCEERSGLPRARPGRFQTAPAQPSLWNRLRAICECEENAGERSPGSTQARGAGDAPGPSEAPGGTMAEQTFPWRSRGCGEDPHRAGEKHKLSAVQAEDGTGACSVMRRLKRPSENPARWAHLISAAESKSSTRQAEDGLGQPPAKISSIFRLFFIWLMKGGGASLFFQYNRHNKKLWVFFLNPMVIYWVLDLDSISARIINGLWRTWKKGYLLYYEIF